MSGSESFLPRSLCNIDCQAVFLSEPLAVHSPACGGTHVPGLPAKMDPGFRRDECACITATALLPEEGRVACSAVFFSGTELSGK